MSTRGNAARPILSFILTVAVGVLIAWGLAKLVGLAFPRATLPVFVLLALWWCYTAYKYLKWLAGREGIRRQGPFDGSRPDDESQR